MAAVDNMQNDTPRWWIGILITVASNVLISLALNCQKLAHMRLDAQRHSSEETPLLHEEGAPAPATSYLRSRLWWMGFLLMALGESGNFVSYGYAPASLVSPLGAVSLLSNVIIAPTLLGERLYVLDMAGIVLSIVGAVFVVSSVGPSGNTPLDPPALWAALQAPSFDIYAACMLIFGITLMILCRTRTGSHSVLAHVGVCAVFGGFTVLAMKGVSSFVVHAQDTRVFYEPLLYVLLAVLLLTAVIQLVYLNQALQRFESRHVIPSQFVLFTISTIVGSSILYHDLSRLAWGHIVEFCIGCLCTFLGVFLLTCDVGGHEQRTLAEERHVEIAQTESTLPTTVPVDVPETPRRTSASDRHSISSLAHAAARWMSTSQHERPSMRVLQRSPRPRTELHPSARTDAIPWWQETRRNTPLSISPGRHLLATKSATRN